jgi:hypothetical protein
MNHGATLQQVSSFCSHDNRTGGEELQTVSSPVVTTLYCRGGKQRSIIHPSVSAVRPQGWRLLFPVRPSAV